MVAVAAKILECHNTVTQIRWLIESVMPQRRVLNFKFSNKSQLYQIAVKTRFYKNEILVRLNTHTQGFLEGVSMYLARKIAEAATSEGE